MISNMTLDPEFVVYTAAHPVPVALATQIGVVPGAAGASSPVDPGILAARQKMESTISGVFVKFLPSLDLVTETKHTIRSFDGAEITIHEFVRKDLPEPTKPSPAVLYLHGGGFVCCPIENLARPCMAQFVCDFGVRTFGVEYRYAPEYPNPTPIEDCFAALKWLSQSAETLKIDPARIAIFGESAGGGLVAGLALMARDRELSPPIAKQLMLYPMLDDRSSKRHYNKDSCRDQSLTQMIDLLDACWSVYLGAKVGRAEQSELTNVSVYASPARATDLTGLPPAYIEVGGLDWFRDEGIQFATALAKADVDVEFHLYRGLSHIYDLAAPDISATKNAKDNRRRAIIGI
ncbi:unnamed protein product [Clonostachys rosea f. rosea IK726]|jgi:acetyl esterase/lipase|uniref:Alpha/beta hydrolase fold-3 domain-containing protein n=2 Tax=Bionectria ochroleuca TaxID=29856 RepID=A0A0B7KSC8_BIOOC|nr:unnamed protein product [Clonostachys rosea f. rosea IK726]